MERGSSPGIERHPLEFSGTGGEFFRVWIVNLLLKIVTIGFYTPFARRRTAQYFYGHTLIGGSPLEFTAQQRKMVLGFLMLVGIYVAFRIAADTGQGTVVTILLFSAAALAPYFWASAMRFRLGSTRWRGVRPQFIASWGQVYRAGWPVFAIAACWAAVAGLFDNDMVAGMAQRIAVIAIALAATLLCIIRLEYNYKSLFVARSYIGGQAGRWKPVYGDFVRIWLLTLCVFAGSVLLVGLVLFGAGAAAVFSSTQAGPLKMAMMVLIGLAAFFLMFLASGPARAYREARVFQLVWNNVGISHIARFRCNLKAGRYVLLRIKNIFLTLLTLGFYRPFAAISEYRMKTQSVTLHVKGGLDQLTGQLVKQQDGLGDAIADAVGLDLVG